MEADRDAWRAHAEDLRQEVERLRGDSVNDTGQAWMKHAEELAAECERLKAERDRLAAQSLADHDAAADKARMDYLESLRGTCTVTVRTVNYLGVHFAFETCVKECESIRQAIDKARGVDYCDTDDVAAALRAEDAERDRLVRLGRTLEALPPNWSMWHGCEDVSWGVCGGGVRDTCEPTAQGALDAAFRAAGVVAEEGEGAEQ